MFGFKSKKKKKQEEIQEENISFFKRLKQGLSKTRNGLTGRLDRVFLGKREIDEDLLDELEEILFTSDLGVNASQELIELVREGVAREGRRQVKGALKRTVTRERGRRKRGSRSSGRIDPPRASSEKCYRRVGNFCR